jgi:hypothetical protein
MSAATRKARSSSAIARREGSRPSYNGSSINAVVTRSTSDWMQYGGAEISEYRYEALIPIDELTDVPAEGDTLIDGTVIYDVVHPGGVINQGFYSVPLRKREW